VRKAFAAVLFLVPVGILSVPSCANQGEGERCDINAANNGSDDCNSGLVCTPPDQLRWPVTMDGGIAQRPSTYICCPPNGVAATTDVCKNMTPSIGSDAAIMDDGSMMSEASSDVMSPSDAPNDSPADTSSDAPTDATGQ
jgi:hypothetical protein